MFTVEALHLNNVDFYLLRVLINSFACLNFCVKILLAKKIYRDSANDVARKILTHIWLLQQTNNLGKFSFDGG